MLGSGEAVPAEQVTGRQQAVTCVAHEAVCESLLSAPAPSGRGHRLRSPGKIEFGQSLAASMDEAEEAGWLLPASLF